MLLTICMLATWRPPHAYGSVRVPGSGAGAPARGVPARVIRRLTGIYGSAGVSRSRIWLAVADRAGGLPHLVELGHRQRPRGARQPGVPVDPSQPLQRAGPVIGLAERGAVGEGAVIAQYHRGPARQRHDRAVG